MSKPRDVKLSKFLSYVLRHKPDAVGIALDPQGWVTVDTLLAALARHDHGMTVEELAHVVATNNKKRFAFSADRTKIRASQGHSVDIALEYEPQEPPSALYHGTVERFLDSIRRDGLTKQRRHHVHLSGDRKTATNVGARRGRPVILEIAAEAMATGGHDFFLSANGVWLTDHVPPEYIKFP